MAGRQNADIADNLNLKDVAMATTFWLLMGCNFSCMVSRDTLFDSRGGFSGSSYPMKTADFEVLRDTAMATILGFLYMGYTTTHWRHLANTTEPSMCGGDAALYQVTLSTCYLCYYQVIISYVH